MAAVGTAAEAAPRRRKIGTKQILTFVVGIVIVVGIFWFAIPRFADYSAVWHALRTLTPLESWSLLAATVFNLFTYWLANQAALPGLRLRQAAVSTQTTTSVANTLPAGGAIAVGLTYAMLGSWGFTAGEATLYVGVTGIWNIFAKLALPVVALALLVITGHTYPALVGAAIIGIAVLVGAVVLLTLLFRSEAMARRVGEFVGRVVGVVKKPFRKPPPVGMGDKGVKFRRETIILVERRWLRLTWTTLLSHLALFFVLLLSLRHMGVSEQELPAVEVFAVFAFGRLLSAVPITPGGVGLIDIGYIGGLTSLVSAGSQEKAAIVAAVLIFRVLTYGIQIPIGGFTYLIWRAKKNWMRSTPPPGSIAGELEAQQVPAPA
ncbi:MAG TPA: lysylphosphatidylglycerol synthase transmembrane domain-containing protein [Actinomycetota bacterium]